MKVLVAGLGISGQAVLRHLAQSTAHTIYAFDSRSQLELSVLQAQFPNVAFARGELPDAWREATDLLVLSPGLDPRVDWIQDFYQRGIEVVGEIELFCRALKPNQKVIAITGSNGKSTVTTLVGELLAEAGISCRVGGNLGTPALDLLSDDSDVYVLELSSFQLETTESLKAISATILNISPDHLDRYDSIDDYISAKAKIYQMTQLAVVNRDDDIARAQCPAEVKQTSFGLSLPTQAGDFGILQAEQGYQLIEKRLDAFVPWFATEALQLSGRHHWANVLSALALCQPFALSQEVVHRVLSRFTGLAHRTQRVAEKHGVWWVNDSKGTNIGATLSALNSIGVDAPVILLAGGQGKGQDFSALAEPLQRYAKALIVFGEDGQQIASEVAGSVTIHQVTHLAEAVTLANQLAVSGDVVLLSPACASFDQFKNYADRGDQFAQSVANLP
jgi:UDP-N-acetylmuramoylalanine--D-glutamate ligase